MKNLKLAFKEIKNSPFQLFIFLFCVIISVSSFVLLENFNSNINNYLQSDSKIIAGGDIIVETRKPYSDILSNTLDNLSLNYNMTNVYELSTNAYSDDKNTSSFIQLKIVGDKYPLYGDFRLTSGRYFNDIEKEGVVFLEENLLNVLEIDVGDNLRIGEKTFLVEDTIANEPDRPFSLFSIGDRALIFESNLDDVNLVGNRSRVEFMTYIQTNNQEDFDYVLNLLKENTLEREDVETYIEEQSSFSEFIDIFLSFMRLILFFTILLAGIGMVSTLNSFISKKQKTIAIMKTLGKKNSSIMSLFLLISFFIALIATLFGVLLGLLLLYLIPILFSNLLPNDFVVEFFYFAVFKGVIFSLGLTLLFSLIPIVFLKNIKPSIILQDMVEFKFKFDKDILLLGILLFLFLFYIISSQFSNFFISLIFIFSFLFVFIFIYLFSMLFLKFVGFLRPKIKNLSFRQAISSFFRPGSKTVLFIATISTALVLIFTIFILETNVEEQFVNAYPEEAPNMFFLDLRQDQLENFSSSLDYDFRFYATISAGIIYVNDIEIATVNENIDSGDPVTRDFSLTYYTDLLDDEVLIESTNFGFMFEENWNSENVQVSVMDTMTERLDLELGDTITFLIQGVEVRAEIVSIRERTSSGVSPFFYFVFEPEVLENAPQTIFTTATFEENRLNEVKNKVARDFPQVTTIDVSQSAGRILDILNQLSSFILFFTIFSLISGFLILISSIISTSSQRLKEVIFYELVGANKKFILKTIFYEYFLLGILSSSIGLLLATIVTYIISTYFLDIGYSFFPAQSLILVFVTCLIVILIGLYSSIGLLRKKPIEYIKENNLE